MSVDGRRWRLLFVSRVAIVYAEFHPYLQDAVVAHLVTKKARLDCTTWSSYSCFGGVYVSCGESEKHITNPVETI